MSRLFKNAAILQGQMLATAAEYKGKIMGENSLLANPRRKTSRDLLDGKRKPKSSKSLLRPHLSGLRANPLPVLRSIPYDKQLSSAGNFFLNVNTESTQSVKRPEFTGEECSPPITTWRECYEGYIRLIPGLNSETETALGSLTSGCSLSRKHISHFEYGGAFG